MRHASLNNKTVVEAIGEVAGGISVSGGANGNEKLSAIIGIVQEHDRVAHIVTTLTAFDLSSETRGTAKLARMVADNTLNTVPRVDVDVTNASFRGQVLPGVVSALNKLRLTFLGGENVLYRRAVVSLAGLTSFVTSIWQRVTQANPTNIDQTVEIECLELVYLAQAVRQQYGKLQDTLVAEKKSLATIDLRERVDAMVLNMLAVETAKTHSCTILSLVFDYDDRDEMKASDEYQSLDDNFKYALEKWYNPHYQAEADDDTDGDTDEESNASDRPSKRSRLSD